MTPARTNATVTWETEWRCSNIDIRCMGINRKGRSGCCVVILSLLLLYWNWSEGSEFIIFYSSKTLREFWFSTVRQTLYGYQVHYNLKYIMGTRLASFLCHNKSIESFGGRNFTSAAVTSHDEEDAFGRWGWWIICIYDKFNAAQYEWMKEWWRSFVFIRCWWAKHTRRQFYYHKPKRQYSTVKSAGEDTKHRWKLVLPLLWTANKKSSEIIINIIK